jgi:hypothetical protein
MLGGKQQEAEMTNGRRMLTDDEKQEIIAYRSAEERVKNLDGEFTVIVQDETDEHGEPRVTIKQGVSLLPDCTTGKGRKSNAARS